MRPVGPGRGAQAGCQRVAEPWLDASASSPTPVTSPPPPGAWVAWYPPSTHLSSPDTRARPPGVGASTRGSSVTCHMSHGTRHTSRVQPGVQRPTVRGCRAPLPIPSAPPSSAASLVRPRPRAPRAPPPSSWQASQPASRAAELLSARSAMLPRVRAARRPGHACGLASLGMSILPFRGDAGVSHAPHFPATARRITRLPGSVSTGRGASHHPPRPPCTAPVLQPPSYVRLPPAPVCLLFAWSPCPPMWVHGSQPPVPLRRLLAPRARVRALPVDRNIPGSAPPPGAPPQALPLQASV